MTPNLKNLILTKPLFHHLATHPLLLARQIKRKRRKLTSVPQVREAVADIANYFERSPDEGFRYMDSFYYQPVNRLKMDPFSQSFRQHQLEIYQELSGKSQYNAVEGEHTEFDFNKYLGSPYPYNSGSPRIIGDHIMAYGHLLKTLNLPIRAKILDIAVGAGETSLMFARAGYQVTAVDINPQFISLVKKKAADMHLNINVICANMTEFESSEKFDAIVFHESFHHCLEHYDLLKKIINWRSPRGVIAFSSEPIDYFNTPWGLRRDGQSLWAIVNFGWMELGFSYRYFLEMTARLGLKCAVFVNNTSHMARVFICR